MLCFFSAFATVRSFLQGSEIVD